MRERDAFEAFVWAVTAVTAALWRSTEARASGVRAFLAVCMAGQLAAVVGLRTGAPGFVRAGHACFSASLWVGALLLVGRPLALVGLLAAVVVGTRWGLGHCMFSAARGSEDTNDRAYDLFYLFPLFVAASHLASNFVEASPGVAPP